MKAENDGRAENKSGKNDQGSRKMLETSNILDRTMCALTDGEDG